MLKKTIISVLTTVYIMNQAFAQQTLIPLWEDEIPNQVSSAEQETLEDKGFMWIQNVQQPTLEVFLPVKQDATGQAVIVCPGGGYGALAYDWEGTKTAKWLNTLGIAAFVLKYRLPTSKSLVVPHKTPLMDAQRAMRLVRENAKNWNIALDKIGIMGFSAGGHLAATVATHFEQSEDTADAVDTVSTKPDFLVLVYPVITMDTAYAHEGSRYNLLGKHPTEELVDFYSTERHVTAEVPPTFLIHSSDDEVVPVMNSLLFYQALQKEKVSAEMHIYPFGGHGYSLGLGKEYLETWPQQLANWLKRLNN